MACILLLDTSTDVCSAGLSVGGELVFERVSFEGLSHASLAAVFANEAVEYALAEGLRPEAVAVGGGPGSYTGLRIGVSLAKGLCVGWGTPLIAVPTLNIMAAAAIRTVAEADCLYCAMLDARRMEVYAAVYDSKLNTVRQTMAEIVSSETYKQLLDQHRVCFFGNGAAKCRNVIDSPNAVFTDGIYPSLADMAPLAEQDFAARRFADVAYFEPFYLKEFIATTPKRMF
ncbi:MAG: tRNA (adenosine(37)-N6)-threonylcarbamoyltransferase complex dimerization subunit type 1 TsaB [Tannerella sp.]|jgi:tRNA threonylcarbamoyladenosine biosynthesis protein TsaB|nr:tRNA (adenosine(37)-N6)-threonylcarbamoyltransferase complex dimerization subunit type 1 TsaB [Tannerella sp.]